MEKEETGEDRNTIRYPNSTAACPLSTERDITYANASTLDAQALDAVVD
jgi:hypothetical protein